MNIVFSGGGTLGHVFPAIAVIKALKKKYPNWQITYIASTSGLEVEVLENVTEIDKIYEIDVCGLNRKSLFKNFSVFHKYHIALKELKEIYHNIKPDIVIGMGGYVSLTAIKAALKMGIKTVIHEQNRVIGLSNKLVAHSVDKVLLSMDLVDNNNYKVIGNPRTSEVKSLYEGIKVTEERQILVVGGSRGADRINDIIISLYDEFHKNNLKVILITGKKYYASNSKKIKTIDKNILKILPYTNNLLYIMMKSELIISRSGATTLSEIIALGIPPILIPSPNVTANHQYHNASYLVEENAGIIIEESSLSKNKLLTTILNILNDRNLYNTMTNNLKKLSQIDSTNLFIEEIEELLNGSI